VQVKENIFIVLFYYVSKVRADTTLDGMVPAAGSHLQIKFTRRF